MFNLITKKIKPKKPIGNVKSIGSLITTSLRCSIEVLETEQSKDNETETHLLFR